VTDKHADVEQAAMDYRKVGRSGLQLPAISLGLWQNFGAGRGLDDQRLVIRRAFELGVTHFDLANNYGPPPGAAEQNFGRILATDLGSHRDELVISTKAGYEMWPGPYGDGGSRKHLLASLDQSLTRLGIDYVDIFYSHRFDEETPLEETMGALDRAVRAGKALYAGISSYSARQTTKAAQILTNLGTPLLIHQPSYSLLDRWIEKDHLLDTLGEEGVGCIVFSPLAQGLLSDRYLQTVPEGSRASERDTLIPEMISPGYRAMTQALQAIAARRGQTTAQLALAWVLRQPAVTSALIGASKTSQIDENLGALSNLAFGAEEIRRIEDIIS
jgi:L-glyceraldehyde 3-phosphate reductase